MMVAIAVMIGSFRETVIYWVGQTLQADLYLRPATRNNVATDAPFSPEVERIGRRPTPSVAAVDRFRNFDLPIRRRTGHDRHRRVRDVAHLRLTPVQGPGELRGRT
jgi:hypothetical protein